MSNYPVYEMFASVQGEGANTGYAALFIRMAGCSVGCTWCDSPEAQSTAQAQWLSTQQIVDRIGSSASNIVITGGEPAQFDLSELTEGLHRRGANIWLETSGTEPIRGAFNRICISPKQHREPLPENWLRADELKIVIASKEDFKWAERCATLVSERCQLFLQPEWSAREAITGALVDYIVANPRWRMSLQTHKYIGIR